MKKYLYVPLALLAIGSGFLVLKSRWSEEPNFPRILQMSGIQFYVPPTPMSWSVINTGPLGSNQVTVVEFELAPEDRDVIIKCNEDGFSIGGILEGNFRLFRDTPPDVSKVCWKQFYHQGEHFFAIYNGLLVYQLIIN